jgi:hypothetical protein
LSGIYEALLTKDTMGEYFQTAKGFGALHPEYGQTLYIHLRRGFETGL